MHVADPPCPGAWRGTKSAGAKETKPGGMRHRHRLHAPPHSRRWNHRPCCCKLEGCESGADVNATARSRTLGVRLAFMFAIMQPLTSVVLRAEILIHKLTKRAAASRDTIVQRLSAGYVAHC